MILVDIDTFCDSVSVHKTCKKKFFRVYGILIGGGGGGGEGGGGRVGYLPYTPGLNKQIAQGHNPGIVFQTHLILVAR